MYEIELDFLTEESELVGVYDREEGNSIQFKMEIPESLEMKGYFNEIQWGLKLFCGQKKSCLCKKGQICCTRQPLKSYKS